MSNVYFEPSRFTTVQKIGKFRSSTTNKVLGEGGYDDTLNFYYVHYPVQDTYYKFNTFEEALKAFNG